MITFAAYVPHHVRWCPAFAACFRAINAEASTIVGGSHGVYSWLMTWEAP